MSVHPARCYVARGGGGGGGRYLVSEFGKKSLLHPARRATRGGERARENARENKNTNSVFTLYLSVNSLIVKVFIIKR